MFVLAAIIIIAGCVFVSILLILNFILPTYDSIKKVEAKNNEEAQKINDMKKSIVDLKNFNKNIDNQLVQKLDIVIPQDNDLLPLLTLIEKLAKDNQLQLSTNSSTQAVGSATLPPANPGDLAAGYHVQSSLTGSYDNTKKFLLSLDGTERVVGIDHFSITPTGENAVVISLSIFAPITNKNQTNNSSTKVILLSDSDKKILEEINQRSIVVTSSGSTSIGRANPFLELGKEETTFQNKEGQPVLNP